MAKASGPEYKLILGKLPGIDCRRCLDDGEREASDEESGEAHSKQTPCNWRGWASCACCMLVTAMLAVGFAVYMQRRGSDIVKPSWEVTQLTIENIDLPGFKGIAPADTSRCPALDACGLAGAKGCSVCPRADMWNDGCLCRTNAKRGSAPAGQVITADTSTCPTNDPCGSMVSSRGCAKCPDSSWISEGCSCRQPPISASEFFQGLGEIFGAITGATPNFVKMTVQAVIEVKNPAAVGAVAEPGVFNISYKGVTIGSAATPRTHVQPFGTASLTVLADVNVVLSSENGMMLMQEALNTNQIAVATQGSVLTRCGPLVIRCSVHCDVEASITLDTRLPRKDCRYGYTLLPQL